MDDHTVIDVIGAGLAGCEAAWQLAGRGLKVRLFEAKPDWFSPAHRSENFAELICSNSLKSDEEGHASALLKEEMRSLGSLILEAAAATRLPAGKALAVDREGFSRFITEKISSHPNIEIVREEVKSIKENGESTVIATGPLTSPTLTRSLMSLLSSTHELTHLDTYALYFYDAIAPIIEADSIDMSIAFKASRYGVGKNDEGDYLNCPFHDKDDYYRFIDELINSQKAHLHDFDKIPCFESCMPVETMAMRHRDAIRFGPMKPVGLTDPHNGKMPYAVVQLRQDDLHATLYNMVGFQTRMSYPEQERVLRTIPGLKDAVFASLGSVHRNTYINSPALLNDRLQLKEHPSLYVIGQLTGVEGYLESTATGLYLGITYARTHLGAYTLPSTTAIGALINHVIRSDPRHFQPMKCSWGIFPPIDAHPSTSRGPKKDQRKRLLLDRAREEHKKWKAAFLAGIPT